ncbi:DNA-directed RNA polymerase II subunit RPB3 [Nematocida displodere]|uniref:DNA-directed RNA polymerase II subunit RPB3 n=1 Tax=Nematocida displodere TaxID=1805483 RepID=A0A177EDU5_9MICR|nr:DNA-directed RNA polymerase II subunit RPB3 [Nematocida displodere]
MVKIEVQDVSEENIKFTLSGCTLAFANALRRVILTEIPTLAIEIVQYDKNYTVIPEEMTTDRLGLIPIDSTNAERYQYTKDCSCKDYCSQCSVSILLDVSNTTDTVRSVTSKSFFVEGNGPQVGDSTFPSLITRLGINQSIKCKCIAVKGKGKTHSKWSPVSAVAFGYDGDNKHGHTRYWHEQNINAEWPAAWFMPEDAQAQSEEFIYDKEPETFFFDVEVVKACLSPEEVLFRAMKILGDKFQQIFEALEDR